jgi:phytanoyl-CoA hydroxylase
VVAPGTHRSGRLYLHEYPNDGVVNKAYHGIQGTTEADTTRLTPLIMEPGDTVFFHPLLHHGSGRNNSKGFRRAISAHYAHKSCDVRDMAGTIQAPLKEEAVKIVHHKVKQMGMGQDIASKPSDELFAMFAEQKYRPVNW